MMLTNFFYGSHKQLRLRVRSRVTKELLFYQMCVIRDSNHTDEWAFTCTII
jgi:hypothetical protein